jgi:hypothetical protein
LDFNGDGCSGPTAYCKKPLLPIWRNVSKSEVEGRHAGLAGIVAITETTAINDVVSKLIEALSNGAPSRAVIPIWEDPTHRFLEGLGEISLSPRADAITVFEFLLHTSPDSYPLWLAGRALTREEMLSRVAQILAHVPDRAKNWVGKEGFQKLWEMCVENGFDPRTM